ncbi:MAG TPA: ComEC/Rec2 family competence protein [Acidimicrobiales bacterium]
MAVATGAGAWLGTGPARAAPPRLPVAVAVAGAAVLVLSGFWARRRRPFAVAGLDGLAPAAVIVGSGGMGGHDLAGDTTAVSSDDDGAAGESEEGFLPDDGVMPDPVGERGAASVGLGSPVVDDRLAVVGTGRRRRAGGPWWIGAAMVTLGLAAVLGQRAVAGLVPPEEGRVRAEVVLVSDPAPLPGGGIRAEGRYRGKRVALIAFRSAAAGLDERLSGEIVLVDGVLRPPGTFEQRLRHRHLAGRLEVDVVMGWRPGHGVLGGANDVRRTLERGAVSLPPRARSLFLGLVIGDDRFQPPDLTAAFQASGLTHLTAVSGQNLSFLLAAAAPVLRRLHLASRLVVTVALLAAFAVVTRAEPSVLRATGMAVVAAYGTAVGRPASGVRALAVATTALLLVDPLLITSLGFRLSVAGAAGILVAARPIARWLPGPSWLRAPLGVTLAAQAAVSPLLVDTFGGVPAVSVVTNLLVAPAAGPVTAWGCSAGLVAGVVGGRVARLLHLPTGFLLQWIDGVAVAGAGWSGVQLDQRGVVATTVIVGAWLAVRRVRRRRRENLAEVEPAHP